jgi:hypothetical protein
VNAVGIDSMVLIYAGLVPLKPAAISDEVNELHIRSKILIVGLAEKKATVFLPTIAISELLVPVPAAQKGLLIAQLEERFVCPPFDLRAAAIAAALWAEHRSLPHDLQYDERHVLKADVMIIASAKAAGAVEFYTADDRCRALANLVMKGRDLPLHGDDLFIRGDIESGDVSP